MSRRIYVAGASAERETRAKPVITALRAAGHRITHDWTVCVDQNGANNEHGTCTPEQLRQCAQDDWYGVERANVLVLLVPENASRGAWVELGIALSSGAAIAVSGDISKCIFGYLPRVQHFVSDAELVKYFGGTL